MSLAAAMAFPDQSGRPEPSLSWFVQQQAVEKVKRAIEGFVQYVRANEPDTRMYVAWRQQDDLTRFTDLFILKKRLPRPGMVNQRP